MGKLDGKIDAVFADMNIPQHPGGVLLVIEHDEIIYRKCYGLADLETLRPISTDSSFYLASLAKPFTAMAIMLLAEQRKLSFEDRLLAYFPQFPSWGAQITLRHLLHHTSGLPTYFPLFSPHGSGSVAEFNRDLNGVTNKAVLKRVMDEAGPDFPAGTQYAYRGNHLQRLSRESPTRTGRQTRRPVVNSAHVPNVA